MAAIDNFSRAKTDKLSAPVSSVAAVVPNDSTDLAYVTRALYVGVSGNVSCVVGGTTVTFKNVPVGVLPVRASRVMATSTTAQEMIAMW